MSTSTAERSGSLLHPDPAIGVDLPVAPSLREHLASSGALVVGVGVAVAAVFLPALIVPYAFTDDYPILYVADGLGTSTWFGDSVVDTVSASGRPLAGLLDQLVFSAAGTIDNLRFVRLLGVLGIVALAVLLHWALVRSRVRPAPAALIAVLVCTLPAFEVYGSWAVLFNAPYAALLGAGASLLAVAGLEGPRGLVVDRLVGAVALLLAATLIYQPSAMIFWVFLAVAVAGTVPDSRRALRLTGLHGGVAAVAFLGALVARKLAVHLADESAPNASNGVFTHDPIGKIGWFLREPLYRSLNLVDLTPSRWLAALVAAVAVVGIPLALRRYRAPLLPYLAIAVALVPLCLLPNLVVPGESGNYRMLGALSALVALYLGLGAIGIQLFVVGRLESPAARVRARRAGLGVGLVFVAAAAVVAAWNVTTRIVVPQNTELRQIRSKVAALPPGAGRVGYVVIAWNQGLTDRLVSDEFIPSSSQPWVPEPAVALTLREQGRLPRGTAPPIVDPLPFGEGAFRTGEPVIDMRQLWRLR